MNTKMKLTTYFTLLALALTLSSCEEYLDKAPSSDLPESAVFNDPRLFKEYVDGIYPYLWYSPEANWTTYSYGGFCSLQMSCLEDATDLSDGARNDAGPRATLNIGSWLIGQGAQAEVEWPWSGSYKAIRICNRILDNVDVVEGLSDTERDELKGQALFFRAFFHFQLVKRYGRVPYVNRTFNTADDMDLERDTYDDCVQMMCDDYDEAASLLPVNFATSEFGRPEKGAAMAMKARALLYAASPLNNPTNDQEKWKQAAQAAYEVIALGRYSLVPKERYQNIFYGVPKTEETIFCRNGGPGGYGNSQMSLPGWGSFELGVGARPWSSEWGSTPCPTQNLMDMYETSDGQKVINNDENYDGLNPNFNTASGYSDEHMYENRDPRMKLTFLLNGEPWLDATGGIELYFNENGSPGKHNGEGVNWTRTGYLQKKFWDPALSPSTGTTYMNWNFIRYTDVIMIYAEAMNEAYGPDNDGLGNGLTPRSAVNQIRTRIGHVDVIASNQEEMRERIRNERAVEFAYEGQRWYDIIRWNKGLKYFNKPVYGIRTTKLADGTFKLERKKIQDRVFKDYMHRYPIPQAELNKSYNLVNNPGWSAESE
ncbi:MAG: RagB/SusD family nutrient uptake outer membrane protein [Prolixibacteraceae bacterium]